MGGGMLAAVLLGLTAQAQEQVCAPWPGEAFTGELDGCARALTAFDSGSAASCLDRLHERMVCLAEPVAVDALGRYARLVALAAFYDQDEERLSRWVQVAMDAAPEAAWPVPGTHPLLARIRELPPGLPRGGPGSRGVAHPKKGGVYLDGQRLERPLARPGVPHLVQVFDKKGVRIGAWWQQGSRFADRLLTEDVAASVSETDLDMQDWQEAAVQGTAQAFASYLEAHPAGAFREDAAVALENLAYAHALEVGSRDALEGFLIVHRKGRHATEARHRLGDLVFVETREEGTEKAWRQFLQRFGDSDRAEEARDALDRIHWEKARDAGDRGAIVAFLAEVLEGPWAEKARDALDAMRVDTVSVEIEAEPGMARAIVAPLAKGLSDKGYRVRRGPPGEGDGALRVVVTQEPVGRLIRYEARLRLTVPGVPVPVVSYAVQKQSFPDDTGVGTALGDFLVQNLPDFADYQPLPEVEAPAAEAEPDD